MTGGPAGEPQLRDVIFQRMDELTPAERKVARTLLARYPAAGLESTAALAAAAGTSKPTVLRLLGRLGFGGYPEFQERLRAEVTRSMNASPLSRAQARRPAPPDDSVFLRAVNLRAGLVTRLRDTVPPAEIERAVSLLAGRPRHVVICGGYFSRLLARLLAMQLDQLIPSVDYADEPLGADIGKYLRAGRDSVVIVFDLRRYERTAAEVIAMAKNSGATLIVITDETLSPSAEQADIVLPVAVDGIPFDSFSALLVLTESLVDAVFQAVGEPALERMADWERSVRIPRSLVALGRAGVGVDTAQAARPHVDDRRAGAP
ncbi:MAG TPA: MurR/RpiR family transcriptional regulator [Trebonia sp.]|nr:MurR/RpiR family transcriptional regulator [Trebonia sp.]